MPDPLVPDLGSPGPSKAYYVERISRTRTTLLVYADSAEDARRRAIMEGEPIDSTSDPRGFGKVVRAPGEDRDE
jgi:hypothetical protein